ncbi:IclR family transcriptional regulator [Lutibaculum baratangense]|uniref:Transcriptional regulator, IclR family n=1 Tax=Lutibaculum baratangense AMV1 TaxID=631454 RepID=V4RJC6_9HYPH|nr:IclR family transcriptional regulator [Lutibaculum baratangense]ESR26201.1 transcriptional regulator, IclR family [Lutibaculum baratangense AMV1]
MASQLNGSVIKAFAILDLFTDARSEVTAGIVARELGINAITAHRFLKTLEHVGALVAVSKGVFRLGFTLVDLGDRVSEGGSLARTLQPILDSVTRAIGEASMATVFSADMVVCIAHAHSGRSLSVDVRVGTRLDAYCTAHGKLWLSQLREAELQRYLETVPLDRQSPHTIVDRAALLEELEHVRRQGFAANDGEREEGIRAIAVPILTRAGRMVSSISVFGPSFRLTDEVMERSLARLRAAALEAEQAMYGGGKPRPGEGP